MINDKQLSTFSSITKQSEVFLKQKHVFNLFSSEESNLIVDHNFGIDKSKPDKQYFVSTLIRDFIMPNEGTMECLYIPDFLKFFARHLYKVLLSKEIAFKTN
jgi:hypothetical protein